MPKRTKEDALGWPKTIKNPKEREERVAQKMKGLQFTDVILKSDRQTVIDWNTVQKFKRNSL